MSNLVKREEFEAGLEPDERKRYNALKAGIYTAYYAVGPLMVLGTVGWSTVAPVVSEVPLLGSYIVNVFAAPWTWGTAVALGYFGGLFGGPLGSGAAISAASKVKNFCIKPITPTRAFFAGLKIGLFDSNPLSFSLKGALLVGMAVKDLGAMAYRGLTKDLPRQGNAKRLARKPVGVAADIRNMSMQPVVRLSSKDLEVMSEQQVRKNGPNNNHNNGHRKVRAFRPDSRANMKHLQRQRRNKMPTP